MSAFTSPRAPFSIDVLVPHLDKKRKLMGLDLGTKTIGIAVSDTRYKIASPLTILARHKFSADADALARFVADENVLALVIGLPLNMNGSEGVRAQSTRAFVRNLHQRPDFAALPMAFWDERLSTRAVEHTMLDADLSRARRAQIVDKLAAAYILQGGLDYLNLHYAR